MAIQHPRDEMNYWPGHLPTWFFIIGYPLYWYNLLGHHAGVGVTSPLAWILFAIVAAATLSSIKRLPKFEGGTSRLFWAAASALAAVILTIVTIAAFKPIHLMQEFDCLQYHYTLPRQHLILGSFQRIPWAADDLFLLPVDFALAPFWLATVLPNKIPQLLILFGLLSIVWRLTSLLAKGRPWAGPLATLAVLATHGFGIQMGTGMLDLAIAYLFLAFLDSMRAGYWLLAGVEFTFFFWSKPAMPLEALLVLVILGSVTVLARRRQWQITDKIDMKSWPKAAVTFLCLSLPAAGPFVLKSLYYAGTPLYPLAPGLAAGVLQSQPQTWHSLQQACQVWLHLSQSYGHGRGLWAFLKHGWLLAVPEQGVNNAYDYPLGLTYLLFIGPFLVYFIRDISRRKISVLSMLAVVIWLLWWFSIQQSRFLYLPLLIIMMVTIARLEKLYKGLMIGIVISLSLEAASQWGAHKAEIARWGINDLRAKDQRLVEINREYLKNPDGHFIEWPSHDVAFAQFPVVVHQESLPHTVRF